MTGKMYMFVRNSRNKTASRLPFDIKCCTLISRNLFVKNNQENKFPKASKKNTHMRIIFNFYAKYPDL